MPYSEKQRIAAAIAEHQPGKLYKRNRGMLAMSREELHDFASEPVASGPVKKAAVQKAVGAEHGRAGTLKSMQRG